MRTLGRRRVNNPFLMGEPVVDNAENIAQILAAPTLLKKGVNISKRDDDGQFLNKERFKNWGVMAEMKSLSWLLVYIASNHLLCLI